jgi:ubiquinone/menaquinone biosynthesis C-methylase UbiE
MPDDDSIKDAVKAKYGAVAQGKTSVCCDTKTSCCSGDLVSISTGYTNEELAALPEGAELGLGCGNPTALAEIHPGEVVVDLGSGAGVDCFLAARIVGERGLVIGVDMTEDMLEKAQANARKGGYANVEFRQGDIENIPVQDSTVDLVISNCVINLAPDKERVFREIYRVLKPGGRFCVSDVVSKGTIPEKVRGDMEKWAGCIAGALEKNEYLEMIRNLGFQYTEVRSEVDYDYEKTDEYSLASVTVVAFKPEAG